MNAKIAMTGAWAIAVLTLSASVYAQTANAPNGASAAASADSTQTATKVDDRQLEKNVHHALGKTKHLTSIGIRVHADAGVVTLTGTVPNRAAVDRAASAAKGVPGVTEVRNNLTIQSN
ncbi:BON domain-containing protein [Paraburkholderia phymatum]|uniref:BON domain-containing protein n=1 Tax=Paraburkholderia phymatum TaxID=148447 RepID=UPI003182448F